VAETSTDRRNPLILNMLDFEKPIIELEEEIKRLKDISASQEPSLRDVQPEIENLEKKLRQTTKKIFANLTPWQRAQVARHPQRPHTSDYINLLFSDFIELHGDRKFGDDAAIITGFAKLRERKLVVIGHQKGKDTKENLRYNFGCANPEGYRKALRVMKLAERFELPIVIFIDTPGAFPGIEAEERGQAEAIANNIREMFNIAVPILIFIIGEGGSGGALGIGIGDKIAILENAYYSVISPEGCAAILWRDRAKANEAARALKFTAKDLLALGIVDELIPEPIGGAHRNPEEMSARIGKKISRYLNELSPFSKDELLQRRYEKFRKIGEWEEI